MDATSFATLALNPNLLSNLETLGYRQMTPIQAKSLPPILKGQDVLAQGKTGSGKTAAFGLGILHHLDVKRYRIQALVLCPTRELADQVSDELRRLARSIHNIKVLSLCGGKPIGPQIGSLEHGAHIIVGTPGRVEDLLRKEKFNLDNLRTLVLDEADRMLEMGFEPALDYIFSLCPKKRQTLLFSATFPQAIIPITKSIMVSPVEVKVSSTHEQTSINQQFYCVPTDSDLMDALQRVLLNEQPESAVVFCNTKLETQSVADALANKGFSCVALHGDLDQRDRDQRLVQFSNKSINVLVATDVAARGLDIDSLDAVINYHLVRDLDVYIHRIGRTGRAGANGSAHTLITEKEKYKMGKLEAHLNQTLNVVPLPDNQMLSASPRQPDMSTIIIDGGKKDKLRAGDILGALTANKSIRGNQVGKINLYDLRSYVAVSRKVAKVAIKILMTDKMKGRQFRARLLHH